MATYAIDDAHGNQITAGLPEQTARETAQRIADERGEVVSLYEMGSEDAEAIEPSALDIDALDITASDVRPSDTDAADGVDVTITVSGEPVGTITGTVTVTPMASGQGYAANADSLETWIDAGPLLDLLEAQSARERRELARAIELAAASAAE